MLGRYRGPEAVSSTKWGLTRDLRSCLPTDGLDRGTQATAFAPDQAKGPQVVDPLLLVLDGGPQVPGQGT